MAIIDLTPEQRRRIGTKFGLRGHDYPPLSVDEDLAVQFWQQTIVTGAALKAHRVAEMTFAASDVWTPVVFEEIPETEQIPGLKLLEDNSIVQSDVDSLMFISGCTRPFWNGLANTEAYVASRIVSRQSSTDPWVENRCLQAIRGRVRQSNEPGTMHYIGTNACKPGSQFRLEVAVSSTDMSLKGWTGFDNPVSVSLQAHGIGW